MLKSRFPGRYPPAEETFEPPSGYSLRGSGGWTTIHLTSRAGEETDEREILFVASIAIALTDSSRVQLCPSCRERLFWRVRRQKFCSSKCRAKER